MEIAGLITKIFLFVLFGGFSAWISIIFFNNITDFSTNKSLLEDMFYFKNFTENDLLGKNLLKRKIRNIFFPKRVLICVILLQFWIALSYLFSSICLFLMIFNNKYSTISLISGNISLVLSLTMWLFFMCGGVYFGYWIKTPNIQNMHINMLKLNILMFVIINFKGVYN